MWNLCGHVESLRDFSTPRSQKNIFTALQNWLGEHLIIFDFLSVLLTSSYVGCGGEKKQIVNKKNNDEQNVVQLNIEKKTLTL